MGFSDKFANLFKKVLPSPFTIAIILTLFVLVMALFPSRKPDAVITVEPYTVSSDTIEFVASGGDSYKWVLGDGKTEIGKKDTLKLARADLPPLVFLNVSIDGSSYTNWAGMALDTSANATNLVQDISNNKDERSKFEQLIAFWDGEMWDAGLLRFLVQMMLMLVLGHALALSKPIARLIDKATAFCTTPANAAALVTGLTVAVSLFNWGLGLIFGAIFARKVGEKFARSRKPLNYALIGAAGYSGLMVWHGGISGSAPIKVAEPGAIHDLMKGASPELLASLPGELSFGDTVFSSMNLTISAVLLLGLPAFMYFMAKRTKHDLLPDTMVAEPESPEEEPAVGAERLDRSRILAYGVGGALLVYMVYKLYMAQVDNPEDGFTFKFLNPNFINMTLLGLCFITHRSFRNFLGAADQAVRGASGILLQFPLYFGILGLMKHSGLMQEISHWFISVSNHDTYPILTFFSAGLVNIFVPSGGGQWAVQGPIVMESASAMGVPLEKSVMALSYGDQVTNMLQPFWALPLLAITGLKAKQILPYTLLLMLVGSGIFILGLLIF